MNLARSRSSHVEQGGVQSLEEHSWDLVLEVVALEIEGVVGVDLVQDMDPLCDARVEENDVGEVVVDLFQALGQGKVSFVALDEGWGFAEVAVVLQVQALGHELLFDHMG